LGGADNDVSCRHARGTARAARRVSRDATCDGLLAEQRLEQG
jgi:hypothetical protein